MLRAQSVLIVEDSYLLLEIVASLCEARGIRVLEASTGEAALTMLRKRGEDVDGLFTDIHLPGLIDGWTVARAFRAIRPEGRIIYTSADTSSRHRGVPGSLFLRKPFQIREIEATIRSMAEGSPAPTILQAAG